MTDATIHSELKELMAEIVGHQLSSVTLVQDYIQFAFDGPVLTTYTLPTGSVRSQDLKWGEAGYRDAICGEIAHLVQHVEVDEQRALLLFDNGATISISLLDEDYVGPEALMFSLNKKQKWIVV